MSDRLVREWIDDFPDVRLNLFADTDGNWLCWAILRGYGTVLWRQEAHPGNRAARIAWMLAGLPMQGDLLPPKACSLWACSSLVDLAKTLAKRAEDKPENKPKTAQKTRERLQRTPAAHSQKTMQQTLDFAAH